MPEIAAAVVTAIAYVGTATTAVVAGTATLAQIATVAAVGIGAGVGSMAAAKALTPEIGSQGAAVRWEANPDAPLRFAFGRVGVKGNIVDAAIYGPDRMYVSFACSVSAAGPIKRFVSFRAGDYYMSFDSAGAAINEPYRGEMWLSTRLGTQPDTALSLPSGLKNGVSFPGWDASRKMSGSAGYLVTLGENSKRSAYEGKIPAFVTTIEGLFCYDPRQDSTYPGGAGSCRLNDPSTWVWSQNPILFALKWALGLWEGPTGKGAPQVDYQVGGIGAKVESIRLTTVVEAANIADANGWTSAAWPSTDDDKAQVLDGFLKAAGARYAEIAGQIAFIHRAAPRAPVFTVRARDTAGPVEIDTASSKLNRFNTVRPRFWSEANEWEMTALPEVTATEWQIEDGQGVAVKRTRGADYTFVVDPKQTRELASLEISNSREGIRGRVPLRPYMDPEPGNTFVFDEPDFALSNLKCFVLDVEDDTENDTVVVTFETETDGKYPFAYGQTGSPPPAQELDPRDPFFVTPPLPSDWVITPRPPSGDGTQQPGFDLTGLVSNATATAVIVEWGPTADGPWTQAYAGPPDVTSIPIVGLQSGATYFIAVRYQRNSNFSDRYVYGPFVAPTLTAGVSEETVEQIVSEVTGQIEGIATGRDAAEHLAEVVLETILDEQQKLESEASQRVEDLLNEAGARNTAVAAAIQQSKAYTDNFASSASQTFATITALNGGLAATLNEAKSFTTGQLSSAMLTVYTKAQTDAGLATTLQSARSYTDTYKSEAQLQFSTKAERASGDANAVIEAKAYTDDYKTQASLTFATQVAMGQANAATLSSAQSYSDGKLATALNTVYTKAQTDSALSTTLQQARSYSDDKAAEASLLYSTKTERANGDASTLQSAKSYTDDYKSTAALTFATQSSLNGVSATAALALSTSQDAASKLNEARIRIVADAQGGQPAVVEIVSSTGAGSFIRLGAQQIGFGDNTVFDDATDTLQTVINGRRRVLALGAPFGQAGDLIEWWGPSNISLGSMTTGNGDNGRMTASPYVFDNTLASAFSASANTGFIGGARSGAGNVQTSNSVTVTVSGGTAGATIRWVRLTGDSRINMNDPTGFTTGAYATIGVGEVISAYFMGAVTKSGKSAVVYVQVDLSDNGT